MGLPPSIDKTSLMSRARTCDLFLYRMTNLCRVYLAARMTFVIFFWMFVDLLRPPVCRQQRGIRTFAASALAFLGEQAGVSPSVLLTLLENRSRVLSNSAPKIHLMRTRQICPSGRQRRSRKAVQGIYGFTAEQQHKRFDWITVIW